MPLNAVALRNAIKSAMDSISNSIGYEQGNIPSPTIYMDTLAETLRTYLISNLTIQYTWVAYSGGGSQDPVTSFTAVISIPSLSISQKESLSQWGLEIKNKIQSNLIISAPAGFITNTGVLTGGTVSFTFSYATDYSNALLHFCNELISMIYSMSATTLSGTHGSYTGSTTGFSIS